MNTYYSSVSIDVYNNVHELVFRGPQSKIRLSQSLSDEFSSLQCHYLLHLLSINLKLLRLREPVSWEGPLRSSTDGFARLSPHPKDT
jgi:Mrp family chromosome partitioning ATPase